MRALRTAALLKLTHGPSPVRCAGIHSHGQNLKVPDGFSAVFFKMFWPELKGTLLELLQDLRGGQLDLFRLNYGILTLIPKIKGAVNIRQYRPICLLNVAYKINKIVDKIISPNQTAFISGRYILDGVVVIHEVLHEMSRRK